MATITMPKRGRVEQPDVISILHKDGTDIYLSEGQMFFTTPRMWELWQVDYFKGGAIPLRRLMAWRESSIVGVKFSKENKEQPN